MNYDYDFPIEKWSERRVAAEKRQNEKTLSMLTNKSSSKWTNTTTTQSSSIPAVSGAAADPNHLLTLCSLMNHCEAIADFEQFKGHGLIAALVSRPHQRTAKKDESMRLDAVTNSAMEENDAGGDYSWSPTDPKEPSSRLHCRRMSRDPEEEKPRMETDQSQSSSSPSLPSKYSSASFAKIAPTSSDSLERLNSDSVSGSSNSFLSSSTSSNDGSSTMRSKTEPTFDSMEPKVVLPVRFCYTRLNAAVQSRLDQLSQHGTIASLVWKGALHPPLPLLASPGAMSNHHSTRFIESSPHYLRLNSDGVTFRPQSSISLIARSLKGYKATHSLTSGGALSTPMTKQRVLEALARVRFQSEGPNASTSLLPSTLTPSRQLTRKLCDEPQREASAKLEARGQTYVIHDSSSVDVDAVSRTQLFHIGDLLQVMDDNRRRENSVSGYQDSADISL